MCFHLPGTVYNSVLQLTFAMCSHCRLSFYPVESNIRICEGHAGAIDSLAATQRGAKIVTATTAAAMPMFRLLHTPSRAASAATSATNQGVTLMTSQPTAQSMPTWMQDTAEFHRSLQSKCLQLADLVA